jgi:hypothetical protein
MQSEPQAEWNVGAVSEKININKSQISVTV